MSYIMSLPLNQVFGLYFKSLERQQEERSFQAWLASLPIMALSGNVTAYDNKSHLQNNSGAEETKKSNRMTEEEKDRILAKAMNLSNKHKEMRGE
ncbi:hypothetical protein [Bacillus mycoides]